MQGSGPLLYFLEPYFLGYVNVGSPRKETKSKLLASAWQKRQSERENGRGGEGRRREIIENLERCFKKSMCTFWSIKKKI